MPYVGIGVAVLMGGVCTCAALAGAPPLMVPDSGTGDRIMLFDGNDGSLIDANWLTDIGAVGWAFTTPKEAAMVGDEIWISDQLTDSLIRFDSARNYLGSITAHPSGGVLDNVRGFGTDGTTVYLTVYPGTAARRGVATYSTAGAVGSFFAINASLFDIEPYQGGLLIANEGTDSIERWSTAGVFQGNFATGVVFPQQVVALGDDSVLAVSSIASNGVEGVYHYNADGSLRTFIDTEVLKVGFGEQVPRGAWLLGDGGYLIATSIGVFKATSTGSGYTYAEIIGDVNAQYIGAFAVDECPADFDGDGFVTGIDYDLYVLAFEAGDMSADFDGDGFITGVDFDQYVVAYEAGC